LNWWGLNKKREEECGENHFLNKGRSWKNTGEEKRTDHRAHNNNGKSIDGPLVISSKVQVFTQGKSEIICGTQGGFTLGQGGNPWWG